MSPTLKLIGEAAEQRLTVGGVWMKADSLPRGVSTTARKKHPSLQSRAAPPWWQQTNFTASAPRVATMQPVLLMSGPDYSIFLSDMMVTVSDCAIINAYVSAVTWIKDKTNCTLIPDKSEPVVFHDVFRGIYQKLELKMIW